MLDEKKKMIAVGALGVVLLGMGAFKLLPSGSAPAPAPLAKKTAHPTTVASNETASAPKGEAGNANNAGTGSGAVNSDGMPKITIDPQTLPPRDPFEIPPTTQDMTGAPKTPDQPGPRTFSHGSSNADRPMPPNRFKKPDVMQGNLPVLPIPDSGHPEGTKTADNSTAKPAEPVFDYHLGGVMFGAHPVAVFADKAGGQRLVSVGGSIDGDAKLVSLSRDEATISFRGRTLRLPLGGDPVEK
jgi:hypothetical protein